MHSEGEGEMEPREQQTGTAATASILAALGSYAATCGGHPGWGLMLAIIAVPLGLLGLVLSASPRVRGGMLSIFAVILGMIGMLFAVLGMVGVMMF